MKANGCEHVNPSPRRHLRQVVRSQYWRLPLLNQIPSCGRPRLLGSGSIRCRSCLSPKRRSGCTMAAISSRLPAKPARPRRPHRANCCDTHDICRVSRNSGGSGRKDGARSLPDFVPSGSTNGLPSREGGPFHCAPRTSATKAPLATRGKMVAARADTSFKIRIGTSRVLSSVRQSAA